MSYSELFTRWYAWLVAPRRGAVPPSAARPHGEFTHDRPLADPPTYLAYHVTAATSAQEQSGAMWSRVGAAWLHPDGMGFDVVLDVMPLDGRFVLRAPLEGPCTRDLPPRPGGPSVRWS